ncbi:MAG: GNAT family N-acetyltransferase [Pirellulales bacterium]|nr:GNAT family N-acetyltransferase [Pirellulales bacterium]
MGVTFIKRYRMEIDLRVRQYGPVLPPCGYRLIRWHDSLIEAHAFTKWECFRGEMDASIFPCLGEYEGCLHLMQQTARHPDFLPEATWLLEYIGTGKHQREYCGTIQGIRADSRHGRIQNVGITPPHRGRGLARNLLDISLAGFQQVGLRRVSLLVTAQNQKAVNLYRRYGFHRKKTFFKSIEVVWT